MTTTEVRSEAGTGQFAPVLPDLSTFLGCGRQTAPIEIVRQAADAERLGLRRGFISERYDIKHAGPLMGACAAVTSRLEVGAGILAAGAYHPLMATAIAATLTETFGNRIVIGLGRGSYDWYEVFGIQDQPGPLGKQMNLAAFEDYIGLIRRLWRGERVSYEGPAGRYDGMFLNDAPTTEPPPIWCGIFAGEKASRVAARAADGVLIVGFITPAGVARCIEWIRDERDKCGLDGPFSVAAYVISTPDFDEEQTLNQSSARFLTYVVGLPAVARAYATVNGWDLDTIMGLAKNPLFAGMQTKTADLSFFRHQLVEAARDVPFEWMRESCAVGSAGECVGKIAEFRAAGVDEVVLYGSTPNDNAQVIATWRERGR
jgi:probable F420-dependent oxidoreductase